MYTYICIYFSLTKTTLNTHTHTHTRIHDDATLDTKQTVRAARTTLYTSFYRRPSAHDDGTLTRRRRVQRSRCDDFSCAFRWGGGSRICLRENRGSNPRARRFLHLERRRMCLRIHKNRTVRVRCISCYGAAVDFEEGFLTQITHFVYRKRSHWRPFGLRRYTTCASAHISPRNRPLVAASL